MSFYCGDEEYHKRLIKKLGELNSEIVWVVEQLSEVRKRITLTECKSILREE